MDLPSPRDLLERDETWTVLALVAAIATAAVSRQILEKSWRRLTGHEPPLGQGGPDTWQQTLFWGLATGAIVGAARAFSQRGTRQLRPPRF